jgi:hypothetical protein
MQEDDAGNEGSAQAPETPDRYAELRSQWRTEAAHELIRHMYRRIADHEKTSGSRVLGRRARSGVRFEDALTRLVGDLLRAHAGTNATGRIYRPTGKNDFRDAPVKYDMFMNALDGLKALGLVEHLKGRTRYREAGFDDIRVTVSGRASRFWATPKLLQFADEHGINSSNVEEHFRPELPSNPLVLRDYNTGRGSNKERGRIIKDYRRTPETERLERDVKELNEFLARVTLTGGRHEAYQRTFNNCAWDKGGRLSSIGEGSYQSLSKDKRLLMTINDEPVAEIDVRACQLTIFHAMVREPLDSRGDPYARVAPLGIDRDVAKRWCLETLGSGRPKAKWSAKALQLWREKGQQLPKVRLVSAAMLDAFPALKQLRMGHWADLQYRETEAVIRTMLVLMRRHGVPSYGIHDSLIVQRRSWELARDILSQQFHDVVGVTPLLRVEPEPARWDL